MKLPIAESYRALMPAGRFGSIHSAHEFHPQKLDRYVSASVFFGPSFTDIHVEI